MTTSGTYSFAPKNAEIIDEAFERVGVDPASLTARHLQSAMRSINLMFGDWTNDGAKQWQIDQQTLTLTEGDYDITAPTGTADVLMMVLRRSGTDTLMQPLSREDYLALPDKDIEGRPDRYFVDKQQSSVVIYLWQAPENSTDQIIYYRLRRQQDAGKLVNTPDINPLWHEAMAAGLASRLWLKFGDTGDKQRYTILQTEAKRTFENAKDADRDRAPTIIRARWRR